MDRSKLLREGAIYLGIYLLLAVITLLIPLIGLFTLFLLPIPFVIYTNKNGLRPGILLGLISFFALFLFIGPAALPLTVGFTIGGIVIGELYRRRKNAFGVLQGGALAFIAALLLNFIGSIVLVGVNPINEMQNILHESIETTEEMLFMFTFEEEAYLEVVEEFVDLLSYVAPTIIIMIGIAFAFIVQWLSSRFLRAKNLEVSLFPPFREWTFPKAVIWYYLIVYIIILMDIEVGSPLFIVTANLRPLLETIMLIQGFSFIFFFFHHKNKGILMPVLIVIVSFILAPVLYLVRIVGIIDLGFELRKRLNSKK
ncbi:MULTISPECIES: YybS family protein [Bacillaceae]|uniref:YybS family protein n=1 Tax=Evansella alkalicola TaxID=745819 RepID=A0ABS6JVR5_9BACI|nr:MULTISPECIES: YybS family protein [Bacillaceae]MBU9722317.1 YybS family protein [Bacillus alkalicola]